MQRNRRITQRRIGFERNCLMRASCLRMVRKERLGGGVDLGSRSPGAARRLVTFLVSPKKGNQKKATLARRSFGLPCAARQAGRLRNSPSQKARGLRQSSPGAPDSVPRSGGAGRGADGCVQQSWAGAPMSAPANGPAANESQPSPRLGCAARRLTRGWIGGDGRGSLYDFK